MGEWNEAEMPYINAMLGAASENRSGDVQTLMNQMIEQNGGSVSDFASRCLNMMMDNIEYKNYFLGDMGMIKAYLYIAGKYGNVCSEAPSRMETKKSPVIWWCWLQGLEEAPGLVKACLASCRQLGMEIKIITKENFKEYVDIPDFILQKYRDGIISNTHFSDILRLELLTTYGGTWIDSTVLITGAKALDYIEKTQLFCFKHLMRGTESLVIAASSWFISACSSDKILADTKAMLYEYWKNEGRQAHYFIFHFFFSIACKRNSGLWSAVPTVSNVPSHIMQEEMFNSYTPQDWNRLSAMSDIHKLTWKNPRPDTAQHLIYDEILERYPLF